MKSKMIGITLTGGDNSVQPHDLLELSSEYPLCEHGILIGNGTSSANGKPRFPSLPWIHKLGTLALSQVVEMNLSLHICGHYLEQITKEGSASFIVDALGPVLAAFEHCQLNFHGEDQGPETADNIIQAFEGIQETWNPIVIFQLDGKNDKIAHDVDARSAAMCVTGLIDGSHGAGVLPTHWPAHEPKFVIGTIGYAGGLGPDNLAVQLPLINEAAGASEWWMDCETKLRGPDAVYALAKCREVLRIATEFNMQSHE